MGRECHTCVVRMHTPGSPWLQRCEPGSAGRRSWFAAGLLWRCRLLNLLGLLLLGSLAARYVRPARCARLARLDLALRHAKCVSYPQVVQPLGARRVFGALGAGAACSGAALVACRLLNSLGLLACSAARRVWLRSELACSAARLLGPLGLLSCLPVVAPKLLADMLTVA